MKWGITYYPKSRYRTWWLRKFGLEVKEIAHYESRAHARLDERVLESEMPGPMNNTPWAKEAKRMGFSAGVTAATASSTLADYEATINKNKADFSVFTYIPNALGDVIAGAQALGEWANNWGAEWRKARFDLGERILDVE